jgi:hypothetical protein
MIVKQWENKRIENINIHNLQYNYPQNIPKWMKVHNNAIKNQNIPYFSTAKELNSFDSIYRYEYAQKLNKIGDINAFSEIKVPRKKQNINGNYYHVGRRAGVIPFIKYHNQIYFGLSMDSTFTNENLSDPYYDLGDFGGGIEIGESIVTGAIREWTEESLSYFDYYRITPDTIATFLDGITVFFVDVTQMGEDKNIGFDDYTQFPMDISYQIADEYEFYRKTKVLGINVTMPEVKGIEWLTINDIKIKIKYHTKPIIYEVILPHLKEMLNYSHFL